MTTRAAVLLAGGRGSRLGGVDKAALEVGGRPLLDRAVQALEGIPTVVVGPPRAGLRTVRETPPFSGPAAAVLAGLAALPPGIDEVLLLAVDIPGLPAAVPLLLGATSGADGLVAVDADGRDQWLLGRYLAEALTRSATALGDPAGRPLRALLGSLALARMPLPSDVLRDVDTVADARAAGVRVPRRGGGMSDDDAALDAWWTTLTQALGLEDVPVERDAILGLAGDAAHGVVRPAAPITTFLAGYAAGRVGGSADDIRAAIERARAAIT